MQDHIYETRKLRIAEQLGKGVETGAAVVTLTTNHEDDLAELCMSLKSLSFLPGYPNGKFQKSPVLIFHEGNLIPSQKKKLEECTNRHLFFPIVHLNDFFPVGFNPEKEWEEFTKWTKFRPAHNLGRQNWSYAQMIRFWTTTIWKHPSIGPFRVIMRMDTDSCFFEQKGKYFQKDYNTIPGLSGKVMYQTNYYNGTGTENSIEYISGLYDYAVEYMAKENIIPANPELWETIHTSWTKNSRLPVFQTNFEVCRKAFFERGDVVKWHESLTEKEPFPVFRRRWGDAQTRVFTMAMFASKEQIILTKARGYFHGRGKCLEMEEEKFASSFGYMFTFQAFLCLLVLSFALKKMRSNFRFDGLTLNSTNHQELRRLTHRGS